jgi:hypothetical protein
MSRNNENTLLVVNNEQIVVKARRNLTRDDYIAAAAYAAKWPSDPFAYARALSRLANHIFVEGDLC